MCVCECGCECEFECVGLYVHVCVNVCVKIYLFVCVYVCVFVCTPWHIFSNGPKLIYPGNIQQSHYSFSYYPLLQYFNRSIFLFSIYLGLTVGIMIAIICSVIGGFILCSVGCFGVYWTQYKRPDSAETVHHESDDNMSGDFIPEILIDFPRISPTFRRPMVGRAAQSFTPEVEALDSPGIPHSEGSDGVFTDSEMMIDSPVGIMESPPIRTLPPQFFMESPTKRRSPAKQPRPRRLSQIEVEALETYTKIFFPEPEVTDELEAEDDYDGGGRVSQKGQRRDLFA